MTNYGTTNLSAEDWKKCEDNFKLNLLYQVGFFIHAYIFKKYTYMLKFKNVIVQEPYS